MSDDKISTFCRHPSPIWVTALNDTMPTWHCSGCGQTFLGDPGEIRTAESRGIAEGRRQAIAELRDAESWHEWVRAEWNANHRLRPWVQGWLADVADYLESRTEGAETP